MSILILCLGNRTPPSRSKVDGSGHGERHLSTERTSRLRTKRAALAVVLLFSGQAGAEPGEDLSCAFFSPDPDDRSGPPIRFHADLSAHGQRAPTDSPGVGRADFVLERDTFKFSWRVSFEALTSEPLALQIHGPVPAEGEAPALFDMVPQRFSSPVEGERILSLGEVAYLVQNLLYVNLRTTKYPEGEIRGLVKKLRPKC